jgi:hypothetical protein
MRHSKQRGAGKTRTDTTVTWAPTNRFQHTAPSEPYKCVLSQPGPLSKESNSPIQWAQLITPWDPYWEAGAERHSFLHFTKFAQITLLSSAELRFSMAERPSQAEWYIPRNNALHDLNFYILLTLHPEVILDLQPTSRTFWRANVYSFVHMGTQHQRRCGLRC